MSSFSFQILAENGRDQARRSRIKTPHGSFDCPTFMPVGTRGSVKGLTPAQVAETGTEILLANTYHLQLRPGADVVAELGGLHGFMGWDRPILTDSGGFQVFSLAELAKIDGDGVSFRSHIDGVRMRLDPASAVEIQNQLGSDIIMAFDQCPPLPAPPEAIREAVDRTIRWAEKCREHHRDDHRQWLFGIIQGGTDPDLRRHCAERICSMGFPGHAIGGLSVGETHQEMLSVLDALAPILPRDKSRYLMGVGMPRDLLEGVRRGVDMFDCVLPTRNGRNAYAFTAQGSVRLRNEKHRRSREPIEPACDCLACRCFSLGYIRHLFIAGEMLGPILVSIHNLRFYQRFMARLRELIPSGNWSQMIAEFPVAAQSGGDPPEMENE